MLQRIAAVLLVAYLVVIGVNWPALPFNAAIADVIFIPMAIAILMTGVPRLSWQRADTAIVIYLLGSLPAIAISADRMQSAIELIRELYVAAIYVIIAIAARHGRAQTIATGLAAGGALLSIFGVIFIVVEFARGPRWYPMGEVMQLPYIGDTLRLRGLTASEAMFACILTACIPFGIALRWPIAVAAMLIAAAFTFSPAIAGLSLAVVIAAWPSFESWPRLRRLAIGGVVVIVLAFNFAATISIRSVALGQSGYKDASNYFHAVDEGVTHVGGATITYDVMSYFRIKQVALSTFVEHPIAGIGLDRFHVATMRAYQEGLLPQLYSAIDPHSSFAGRLAETGIIGGVTLLLLWIAWARMAVEVLARGTAPNNIALAAAAALAGLIINSLNADVMNFRFLWVAVGLMRGLQDDVAAPAPESQTRQRR
jgi:O-antigen ligase